MKKLQFLTVLILVICLPLLADAARRGPGRGTGPGVTGTDWITVYGQLAKGQAPKMSPSEYVTRYNQVLLANGTDTPMKVKFGNGTDCKELSNIAFMTYQWALLRGCIVTTTIPPKSVIEFYPDEGGTFKYEIDFVGTTQKLTGTLKVF